MTNVDYTKQFEEALAPVKALNKLALENVERAVDLNLESLRKYADVVLDSWKDALAVTDMKSGQEYLAKQGQVAQDVVKNLAEDAKAAAELGQEYARDLQKVVTDSVAKASKKAA
jgi:phasin family protein